MNIYYVSGTGQENSPRDYVYSDYKKDSYNLKGSSMGFAA